MGDQPDWSNVQSNILFQGVLALNGSTPQLDVSEFNAVIVSIGSVDGVHPSSIQYYFRLADGSPVDQGLLSMDDPSGPGAFALPVIGNLFSLTSTLVSSMNVTVAGTTQPLPKRVLGGTYPVREFAATAASGTAAAHETQLISTDIDLAVATKNASSYNGTFTAVITVSPFANAGNVYVQAGFIDGLGNRVFKPIAVFSAAATQTVQFGHPFAYCTWWFFTVNALTGPVTVDLVIFPASTQ